VIGYELMHEPALWEYIVMLIALPVGMVAGVIILLEIFYNDWYEGFMDTPPKAYTYGKATTNWGRLTDPYYNKETDVNGVPVLYYKRSGEGYVTVITNTIDCPSTIDWHSSKFTWAWIPKLRKSGWMQNNPPAKPSIIASTGMWPHIDRILAEEQAAKTGNITDVKTHKQA